MENASLILRFCPGLFIGLIAKEISEREKGNKNAVHFSLTDPAMLGSGPHTSRDYGRPYLQINNKTPVFQTD